MRHIKAIVVVCLVSCAPTADEQPMDPERAAPALPSCEGTVTTVIENCDGLQRSAEFFACAQLYVPESPEDACGGECPIDPATPWSQSTEGWWDGFEGLVWLALYRSPELGDDVQECAKWDSWAN